jgi:kynurenine 3-monooxygenase
MRPESMSQGKQRPMLLLLDPPPVVVRASSALTWPDTSTIGPRKVLTERLLEAATESGVHVHYQHRLNEVDFENKMARFAVGDKNKETETIEVEYDLLIGADGCYSKVRNLMVENKTILKDFTARTEEDSMEYQVVVLPKSPFANTHPEGTVHSWNNKEMNSICLGFPMSNNDASNSYSMLFAVVFPGGKLESFRKTGYKEPLTKLLPDLFNDGDDRMNEFARQLQENHIANGGLCVWSSSLGHAYEDAKGNASGVVLLGDSAHGMWPSLGQGANCALESVAVFVRCLDELARKGTESSSSSWTKELIQTYHDARFEDAKAAVDLTYGGIGSRKSRGRLNAPLSYKLQMVGMVLLHKLTFGIVPMPALLRIMMGKEISYSTAKKFNFYYEKYICLGALVLFAGIFTIGMTGFPNFSGASSTNTEL